MAIVSETVTTKNGYKQSRLIKLLDNASVDETASDAVAVEHASGITMIVDAQTSVSGGVVELEGAYSPTYAGTWQNLGTVTTNAATKLFSCSAGLNPVAANGAALPMPYVRARISTVISGGTVDIYLVVTE